MLLTATTALTALLAAATLFVSRRSPRHAPIALAASLALASAILDRFTFSGTWHRPLLHVAEFLRIAPDIVLVGSVIGIVSGPLWITGLARLAGFVTMATLIVRYGRSPRPEIVTFAAQAILAAVIAAYVAPRRYPIADELSETDEAPALLAVFALTAGRLAAALARIVLPASSPAATVSAIVGTAVAAGFYAPLAFAHAFRNATPEFVRRQMRSRRRYAIYEAGERIDVAREIFASLSPGDTPSPRDFFTAGGLARAAGRERELLRLAATDRAVGIAIEMALAIAWSTGPDRAESMIAHGLAALDEIERIKSLDSTLEEPMSVEDVIVHSNVNSHDAFVGPLLTMLLGAIRSLPVARARIALEEARRIVSGAVGSRRRAIPRP